MMEKFLVKRIIQEYRRRGAWCEKIHGNDFMRSGIVDIIACYKGFFIGIEAKQPGNYPTEVQSYCRKEIHQAHGISLVAYTLEEATRALDSIDNSAFYGSYACLVCGTYMIYNEQDGSVTCQKGHMIRRGTDIGIIEEGDDELRLRSKNAGSSKAKPGKKPTNDRGKLLTFPTKGVSRN